MRFVVDDKTPLVMYTYIVFFLEWFNSECAVVYVSAKCRSYINNYASHYRLFAPILVHTTHYAMHSLCFCLIFVFETPHKIHSCAHTQRTYTHAPPYDTNADLTSVLWFCDKTLGAAHDTANWKTNSNECCQFVMKGKKRILFPLYAYRARVVW